VRIFVLTSLICVLIVTNFGQGRLSNRRLDSSAHELEQIREKKKKPGRDGADPPPSVPPLPPGPGSGPSPQPPSIPPQPPVLGEWKYEDTLADYITGEPIHSRGEVFCRRIAAKIREQVTSGRRVQQIVIAGFADGTPNDGVVYDLNVLPPNCRNGVSSPLDDNELALLRGCVIFEKLKEMLGEQYAGGEGWQKPEAYDEPDWVHMGGKYRKVHVEITFRRISDEKE
jgi:hypothetical protein